MIAVRSAQENDASDIQRLLLQLGYSTELSWIEKSMASIRDHPVDGVLIAEEDGKIIGLVSLHTFDLFHQAGRMGRITSLVVDANARRKGVGSRLLEAADGFFLNVGCVRAEVTSGDHRPDAHAFYTSQGYACAERRFLKRYS